MPAELRSLHASAARWLLLHAGAAFRFQRAHTIRLAGGCRNGKFQNLSPPSVLFKSSQFFYNTQKTQKQIMMDQSFEIWILWFLRIFFRFLKRRRAVPLRPIWTIMVAAKLDHSSVFVTKFRENRSTLKDRNAGQRHTDTHTDRQTNSAENNSPSGLHSGH